MDVNQKARVIALAKRLDLSDSCGALLYMTAVMESDGKTLIPKTEEERLTWDGHMYGLVAALHCIAMEEQQYDPEVAAEIVGSLLDQARYLLQKPAPGSGR